MFGPRVDQGHVEPVMCELAAGVAADGAGADHRDALIHDPITPLVVAALVATSRFDPIGSVLDWPRVAE